MKKALSLCPLFVLLQLAGHVSKSVAFTTPPSVVVRKNLHHPMSAVCTAMVGNKKHHVTIAGNIWPAIQKFRIGPEKAKSIVSNIAAITDWKDLVVLFIFAFASGPFAKYTFERWWKQLEDSKINGDGEEEIEVPYNVSKRLKVANFVSEIARLALSVYAVDVLSIFLTTIGFKWPNKIGLSTVFAKLTYTIWAASRFLLFKRIALCRFFKVDYDEMGRVELLNRFLNGLIVAVVSLVLFDWFSVKAGTAMKGLFAFGSVGTLAFTLASQGLVSQLLSGIFLIFSNKMYVGDIVQFGDGTSGKVENLGWMETTLRGSDNMLTRVPNAMLSSQKVSNLSRLKMSQVKQTLRFHYDDAEKIPEVLEDIREEIQKSCPRLITNNSRPFRVFWTNINEDHLEVMVDTHHNIAPLGDAYWKNRQEVLMAIHRAVKKNNLKLAEMFSIPAGKSPEYRVIPREARDVYDEADRLITADTSLNGEGDDNNGSK